MNASPSRPAESAVLAALVVLVATAVVTGPWLFAPGVGFVVRDAGFALVSTTWLQTALRTGADLWQAPLGWPLPDPTTLTDWTLGQALLGLPMWALGVDPYTRHEGIVAVGLLTSALVCERAAAAWVGPGPHTWVAGVVGGLSSAHLSHAQHLNLVHHAFAFGGGLLLATGMARRRPLEAALGGLSTGLSGHFGAYMGLHAVLVAGVIAGAAALGRLGGVRVWGGWLLGLGLGFATMVPVLRVYAAAAERDAVTVSAGELAAESWDLAETLVPLARAPLHDHLLGEGPEPLPGPTPRVGRAPARVASTHLMDPPNPGYLATGLALLGLFAGRRRAELPGALRWAPVLLLGAALLLALGPEVRLDGAGTGTPGPAALVDRLLGGPRLRAPARWFAVAWAAVGLLAASGLARGMYGRSTPVRIGLGAAAVGIALGEVPRAATGSLDVVAIEPAARAVDAVEGEGALYENHGPGCGRASQNFHAALYHGRPLVGGNYARAFAAIQEVNQVIASWPAPEARVFLEAVGTRVTFEHPPLRPLPADAPPCQEIDRHRVCTLTPREVPARLSPTGSGPVVGLRWPGDGGLDRATIRCGDTVQLAPLKVWATLTRLRLGRGAGSVEVLLDQPCPTLPTVDVGAPTPLYLDDPTPWLPAPGPRPAGGIGAAPARAFATP